MDQPPTLTFIAFVDAWPRAIETEIGADLNLLRMHQPQAASVESVHSLKWKTAFKIVKKFKVLTSFDNLKGRFPLKRMDRFNRGGLRLVHA